MGHSTNPIKAKLRQLSPIQLIPPHKHPYLVQGSPGTILYLTQEQAEKRFDLIPQFVASPAVIID